MRVEILGSGGATTTPRPGCACRVCVRGPRDAASRTRARGRACSSTGPDLVFDTPEESKLQLDRPTIGEIAGCFYSHWHPDHMMGRRVWETRNARLPRVATRGEAASRHRRLPAAAGGGRLPRVPRRHGPTSSSWSSAATSASTSSPTATTVAFGDVDVRPFRLAADYVYAFELREGDRRLLLAMDELVGWRPPPELRGCDLAVLPMGICEYDPFTGERLIDPEHPDPPLRGDLRGDARRWSTRSTRARSCSCTSRRCSVSRTTTSRSSAAAAGGWDAGHLRLGRARRGRRVMGRARSSPLDLGAVRANASAPRRRARRRRALGRRQGRRVRARRGRRGAGGARGGRDRAVRDERRRRRSALRPAAPERSHHRPRPDRCRGRARRARGRPRARRARRARSPRASPSTSSWTRAWGAGGCRSCPRPAARSSG